MCKLLTEAGATQSPLTSYLGRKNATKLNRLLKKGGETALRRTFKRLHPPKKLKANLNANHTFLRELRRKNVIREHQWEKMFGPAHGAKPDSDTFDFALLYILMTCVFNLPSVPSETDVSERANIVRLKALHDELCIMGVSVDEQTSISKCQEVSTILENLGLSQEEMFHLKERCEKEKNPHGLPEEEEEEELGGVASSPGQFSLHNCWLFLTDVHCLS